MKTMTFNQLGGACDEKFTANTFNEIADMSKRHGMEMFQQGDEAHLEAMSKMKTLMQHPTEFRNGLKVSGKSLIHCRRTENKEIEL